MAGEELLEVFVVLDEVVDDLDQHLIHGVAHATTRLLESVPHFGIDTVDVYLCLALCL